MEKVNKQIKKFVMFVDSDEQTSKQNMTKFVRLVHKVPWFLLLMLLLLNMTTLTIRYQINNMATATKRRRVLNSIFTLL